MITFLESTGSVTFLPKITISTMTEKGEHSETYEFTKDNIYKITAFDSKLKKLISYTGKVSSYTVSTNNEYKKNFPIDIEPFMNIKSLVLDCSEENKSVLVNIDICNIRDIKVYTNAGIETIKYGIKEFK